VKFLKKIIQAATLVVFLFFLANLISFVNDKTMHDEVSAKERIGNSIKGALIYNKHCAACHQPDGKGMKGMLAADLTDKERMKKTDDELLKSIRKGYQGKVGSMPPWENILDDNQMKNVLQYIRDTF
jgi:mono/diheme cytochrome c family protein